MRLHCNSNKLINALKEKLKQEASAKWVIILMKKINFEEIH